MSIHTTSLLPLDKKMVDARSPLRSILVTIRYHTREGTTTLNNTKSNCAAPLPAGIKYAFDTPDTYNLPFRYSDSSLGFVVEWNIEATKVWRGPTKRSSFASAGLTAISRR